MKVAGFTFIRNAVKYDYPIVEAITSILPLCDEFIVALGDSQDATQKLIEDINSPKIRIVHTVWDESLWAGGRILAVETDKALAAVSEDIDWAFYIQGDEVVHEKYHVAIRQAMLHYKDDKRIDGLLFKYLHFFGSYKYVGDSLRWYQNEIRIIRPHRNIYSYRDAQGFRKEDNKKLLVKPIDAYIYHYGWVKEPLKQKEKLDTFGFWWNPNRPKKEEASYDYSQVDSLALFEGTHPAVMKKRVENQHWVFEHDVRQKNLSLKFLLKYWVKKYTGWHIGEYRNYTILR